MPDQPNTPVGQVTAEIEDIATGQFHRDRLSRWFLIIGALALVASLALGIIAITRPITSLYDPLGPYPVQGTDRAIYRTGGVVIVTAQKCAKSDGVMTAGRHAWTSLDEPGVSLVVDGGKGGTRFQSCGPDPQHRFFVYHNAIPPSVSALVRTGAYEWKITGTDIPYKSDGEQGVPRTWSTNAFEILP